MGMSSTSHSLPAGIELKLLLAALRPLCWGAADILRAYARGEQPPYDYPRFLDVQSSSEGPVSTADQAVNQWLLNGLQADFPYADWALLSEETAKNSVVTSQPLAAGWLWIIDPLDGTRDFLQGTGEYAVHLALVHEQRPVLGVVLLPEANELWLGVVGKGVWCEDREGQHRPASFSSRCGISELSLVVSRSHRDERLGKLIAALQPSCTSFAGSVGYKIAAILRGDADFYISLSGQSAPKDWDIAAPEAILLAAGGCFTHADGSQIRYNRINSKSEQTGCLIASHGISHVALLEAATRAMLLIDPSFQL
ncbi:3'(2'),5'-bisphosphate nucleotidase CysQ [cyanobiont of Ornithocercus magnificus]|nr:3'(2'),5'-bisphosphate nucleotidase CysQ [cyanobiont of Ornithocercus magnificus]